MTNREHSAPAAIRVPDQSQPRIRSSIRVPAAAAPVKDGRHASDHNTGFVCHSDISHLPPTCRVYSWGNDQLSDLKVREEAYRIKVHLAHTVGYLLMPADVA